MADKYDKKPGKSAVVVSINKAARELARQRHRRDDPLPHEPRGANKIPPQQFAGKPPNWHPNSIGLPADPGCECPVEALGHDDNYYYFITSAGTFKPMRSSDLTHSGIQDLFSATPNYPDWCWPRHGKVRADSEGKLLPPPIEAFKDDAARKALMYACTRRGKFSPRDKLRGLGAWALNSGEIVYHAGEELWRFDHDKNRPVAMPTGLLEGKLYPSMKEIPAPWTEPIGSDDNTISDLLEAYRQWNWRRPDIDPLLKLGHDGVGYLGAAWRWRAAVALLGDRSTGKSRLQSLTAELHGDAIVPTSETTAAGIYQEMAHDARMVAVDELEPTADTRAQDSLVKLMRIASSGAFARRGGQSGTPTSYQLRCTFLFSSINSPLHDAADLSRVAILRLLPIDKSRPKAPPVIDAEATGPKLLHTMMREWPRFEATFALYSEALTRGGHDNRGCDTYGMLLTCADLALGPDHSAELGTHSVWSYDDDGELIRNEASIAWWAEHLAADTLPEIETALPNWRKCLGWLLTKHVEPWRKGSRTMVGQVMEELAEDRMERGEAKTLLADTGLGLVVPGAVAALEDGWVLAVPNEHPQLRELFRDTPWARAGWSEALRQCPIDGVMIADRSVNRISIGGNMARCTLVVMKRFQQAPER
jgi:hypothetical protein